MKDVFKLFDTDGDGVLDFNEFQRAFRAIGLKKRDGTKYDVDMEMFKSFDKSGALLLMSMPHDHHRAIAHPREF